ncbi:HypC/HybG/HupF family hydrogenase formation chaperone [Dactylosporangium sp. NPDC005572]|uniref:HypC/HybG/HupF family hydrogenase formation chaperone n=1 Tax=Dactylosporangium sp. NPDC005572 TaxID=3156889 RepID=UPI0033AE5C81
MCLGIPGQIVEIVDPGAHLAKVDVSGVRRTISIRLLAEQDVAAGDWVLVHVGFAMAKIDEREAALTIEAMRRMGQAFDDELAAFDSTAISLESR